MTATACGKVILLGEHAVVHGHPALAASITPGASALATRSEGLTLRVSPWERSFLAGDGSDLGRALSLVAERLEARDLRVEATLHLPGSGGLGGSAALGVAVIRALARAMGRNLSDPELLEIAFGWERVFHGNPSGIDHTLAALGGVGVFTRREGLTRLSTRGPLRLCLADSGERASTKDLVFGVEKLLERRPETTTRTFEAIAALVRNGALALSAGDLSTLGALMNHNQALLAALFVSTPRIEALCAAAREAGALGAKLTGSGGGGCVVALAGDQEDAVLGAWRALGAPACAVEVGT